MINESLGDIISRMNFLYSENKESIDRKESNSPASIEYQKYVDHLNEFEDSYKRLISSANSKMARIDSLSQRILRKQSSEKTSE